MSDKIDDPSNSVSQFIDESIETNDDQLNDHETRISKLEKVIN